MAIIIEEDECFCEGGPNDVTTNDVSDDGSGTTKLVSVLNEEYRQLLCLKDVKAE